MNYTLVSYLQVYASNWRMGLADGGQKALMETYKENKKQRVEETMGALVVQADSAAGGGVEDEGQVQGWDKMEEGGNSNPPREEYCMEAGELHDMHMGEGWDEGEDEAWDDPQFPCENDEQWVGWDEHWEVDEGNEEVLDGEEDEGGEGEIKPIHLPPGYGTTWVWRTFTYFD